MAVEFIDKKFSGITTQGADLSAVNLYSEAAPDSPGQCVQTRLVGKNKFRDIYAAVVVSKDGSTVFDDEHRLTPLEVQNLMLSHISPNRPFSFPDYPYPIKILPGEVTLFNRIEDAVGNTTLTSRFYVLGDHYKNGIGEEVSRNQSWSFQRDENGNVIIDEIGNPVKEEETIVFMRMSYTPYRPGEVVKRVIRTDAPAMEFEKIKKLYEQDERKIILFPIMNEVSEQAYILNSEGDSIASIAAD